MPEGERNYTQPAQKKLYPEEDFLQHAKIHLSFAGQMKRARVKILG
jgi:hypothetical protein